MEQLWPTLILGHVILPLAGAVLFLLARGHGSRAVRTIVVANVAGSLLLAVMMIGGFLAEDQSPDGLEGRPNRSVHIPWLAWGSEEPQALLDGVGNVQQPPELSSTSTITLSLSVDGVSVWFLAAIPLIVLCVLLDDPVENWSERPVQIIAILITESAALTAFMAGDVVLLSSAFAVLALANSVAVGSRGGPGIRTAARMLLLQQLGAAALISISLVGTAIACSHMLGAPHTAPQPPVFNLDLLILEVRRLTSLSPPAQFVWKQLSPWLFLSLVMGCCLWTGAFPFHVTPATALRTSSRAGRALFGGITLKLGAFGLIRIALPLFPELITALGPFLLLWIMLSALYCAVSMYGTGVDAAQGFAPASLDAVPRPADPNAFLAEGAIVIVLLSACGALSQTVSGIVGATLLLLAHAVCWMLYVLGSPETGSSMPLTTGQRQQPWILVMLALAGVPGLALFPGLLLMFLGISASPVTVASWLAMLLLYWLVIAISGWAHLEQARAHVATGPELSTTARVARALLIAIVFLIGLAPGIFTGRIQQCVIAILGQQPQ